MIQKLVLANKMATPATATSDNGGIVIGGVHQINPLTASLNTTLTGASDYLRRTVHRLANETSKLIDLSPKRASYLVNVSASSYVVPLPILSGISNIA
jgi:hypothetical protein